MYDKSLAIQKKPKGFSATELRALDKDTQYEIIELLRKQDLVRLKKEAYDDFYIFCRDVMQAALPENRIEKFEKDSTILREYCDFLQFWKTNRKLVELPRDIMKSTIGSIYYSVWRILRDPNIIIHIDSELKRKARELTGAIREIFDKNEIFRELYGDFTASSGWTEEKFTVSKRTNVGLRESTMSCGGVDAVEVGTHTHLWIMDDMYSQGNTKTKEQIGAVIDFYRKGQPIIGINQVLYIGTIWSPSDLGEVIKDEKSQLHHSFEIMCQGWFENNQNICPSKYTEEYIELMRSSMTPVDFSRQYDLKCIVEDTAWFKPEYFKNTGFIFDEHWKEEKDLRNSLIYITIDPAFSAEDKTKKRDSSAILVSIVDENNDIWIMDEYQEKLKPDELVSLIYSLFIKWKKETDIGVLVGIEQAVAQRTLHSYLEYYGRQNKQYIPTIELKHNNNAKPQRIMALEPYARNEKIHIEKRKRKLYEQLIAFVPYVSDDDDLADAAQYILQISVAKVPELQEIKLDFAELKKKKLDDKFSEICSRINTGRNDEEDDDSFSVNDIY